MQAAILALSSSFLASVTMILMKKAIERTNPTSAMLVVTLVGSIIYLLISLFTVPFSYLKSDALIYFLIAGLFSPALVRWLYFISLDRIGPSVSSSILATGPAFTAVIAVVLLNEKITLQISLGILTIIGGIVIFERDMHNQTGFGSRNSKRSDFSAAVRPVFQFCRGYPETGAKYPRFSNFRCDGRLCDIDGSIFFCMPGIQKN